eukprot:gnl/TRDRNA2_/TRDRNA2_153962_c2_seq1.p3 gnl/TRDRNA2_/TRDRNA2_153962_c2~~gnl/TRDRNA2_/TRDRNA2_153962_c2_seq1.p3  ORF type:complete len:103 (+),score=9.04 gnl/TRDRNA2_/TRDRNA2_153962_c2_seq1:160-468(+)
MASQSSSTVESSPRASARASTRKPATICPDAARLSINISYCSAWPAIPYASIASSTAMGCSRAGGDWLDAANAHAVMARLCTLGLTHGRIALATARKAWTSE